MPDDSGRHDGAVEQRLASLEADLAMIRRSPWSGDPVYRGLPAKAYRVEALPDAADYRDRIVILAGVPAESGGAPDVAYISLRDHEGTWEWCVMATGTEET